MTNHEHIKKARLMSNAGLQEGPVRVLHYIGSLNVGGSQSMIMNIYRNIDRKKIQFDFVVDRQNEVFFKKEVESYGGRVYVFDEYFRGYNYFSFMKQWKSFFKEHPEYRILHCHVRSVASVVLRIAKKNRLKTICHSHSISNGSGPKVIVKKILQRGIKKYCDYYLACSEESAIWLYGDRIAKSNKCMVVNNAIDVSKYAFNNDVRRRVRKTLDVENKIVLGQVGRIEAVKNYDFSLDLLKKLLEQNSRYHFVIVGTGSLKNDILKKAKALGINDNITILENRNDVNELMQAMDIFIMPSLWEGLPVSLVEAQAASLPCVISDKVKDGIINGDLVKKIRIDNSNEWYKMVISLSENKKARKDSSGVIRRKGFDIQESAMMMSEFYDNFARGARRKVYFCLGSMEHGGAERVVANLSNYFVKENEVKIIVTKRWKPEYYLDEKVGHFVLDDTADRGWFLKRTVRRVARLRGIIRSESPDLVIAFLPEPSFRLMVAKAFLPVKTIISERNDPNVEYNNFFKKMLVGLLYSRADGFVFQTPDAQKWFSKKIQSKSMVIPNPVDKSFLRRPYNGEREKRIVTVGRLAEQKNQKLLIDVFSRFYNGHKDYKLEIYGEGPLRAELQKRINKYGLADVARLMGEVPNVGDRIYKAKMFVLTSDYEGMPNALMEAMALGLPCISTDCPIGGPRYLMKKDDAGILVRIGDLSELEISMARVAEDKKLSKKISTSASYNMRSYDIQSIILVWWEFMMKVMA